MNITDILRKSSWNDTPMELARKLKEHGHTLDETLAAMREGTWRQDSMAALVAAWKHPSSAPRGLTGYYAVYSILDPEDYRPIKGYRRIQTERRPTILEALDAAFDNRASEIVSVDAVYDARTDEEVDF